MNLVYPDGSLVLVRRNINIENGDNAVILLPDEDEATLKKVMFNKNILTLLPQSNKSKYIPKTIDLNQIVVKIIGKVIAAFRVENN